MENINIKINKKTRQVNLTKSVIGNDGENLQEKLIFQFDEFVNGTARLELLKQGETASYIMLTKVNETYELPIKSVITKAGRLNMQLVITEGTNDEEIPIFKSNQFYMIVNSSINAEIEEEEEYPQWIDVANTKLNEIDEALDDLQEKVDSGYFKGEKGDKGDKGDQGIQGIQGERGEKGEQGIQGIQGERGLQGEQGIPGKDGKDGQDGINGTNGQDGRDGYVQYTAGDNITIENNVISAIGGGAETQKIPATVYLDTTASGIYFFNKDISSVNIKKDANSYGWSYYKPFLLIIKENYNPEVLTGEPLAVVYYSGSSSSPALSFTEFYTDSQGNILRENTGAGDLLNSLNQSIFGEKTFFTIPKQGDTTAPTQNTQFTNKKYVDDMIASISGGGDVVEKVTTSTSEPFVFEGKKKGLYYITNSSAKFHYKVTETSSVQSNNLRTIFLFLISDFGEITSGTFAHTIYINPSQGGNNGNLFIGNCTISNGNIVLNSQSTKLGQVVTTSDQQIDGIKTFTSLPLSSVVPTTDTQLANKKYVDDSISSAIGNINTILATLTTPSNGGE